jgi:hypothetical protein
VLTIYDTLDPATGELRWKDLRRGPYLPTTRAIPALRLMRTGGACWRGNERIRTSGHLVRYKDSIFPPSELGGPRTTRSRRTA